MSGVVYSAMNGIQPSLYGEMFPTRVRLSGMAIGTQIGFAIGGFAPTRPRAIAGDGPERLGARRRLRARLQPDRGGRRRDGAGDVQGAARGDRRPHGAEPATRRFAREGAADTDALRPTVP